MNHTGNMNHDINDTIDHNSVNTTNDTTTNSDDTNPDYTTNNYSIMISVLPLLMPMPMLIVDLTQIPMLVLILRLILRSTHGSELRGYMILWYILLRGARNIPFKQDNR